MSSRLSLDRKLMLLLSLFGLAGIYLFQDAGWVRALRPIDPDLGFLFAKSCRFLLNDAFALLLIWSLFPSRGHLLVALLVQAAGLVFILIPYLILKLSFDAGDGPLISFLHRLVLNPTLLLLLIPSFWFLGPKREE